MLKYHPDLQQGSDGVEAKFLAIQEAYEILIGKRRGKEVDSTPAGWDLHDWYWKFSMNRRKGGASSAAPSPEVLRHQWRQQMSGLKAKAAAKAAASRGRGTRHAGSTIDPRGEKPRNPTEAAASSVWRSTTKNARKVPNTHSQSTTTSAFSTASQQHQQLKAEAATVQASVSTAPAVTTASQASVQQLMEEPRVASVVSHSTEDISFAAAAANAVSASAEEQPVGVSTGGFAPITSAVVDTMHTTTQVSSSSTSEPASETYDERHVALGFRVLLTKAVHAVHDLRHRHETTVHAHAQRIHSHITIWSDKLTRRLQLHALQHLISPEEQPKFSSPLHPWRFIGDRNFDSPWNFSSSATGSNSPVHNGVPKEQDLHNLFEEAMHSMHSSMNEQSVDPGNEFVEACASSSSEGYGNYTYDAHSRKFADKQHVRTRLSTQLSGLKRRAAMKREFDD